MHYVKVNFLEHVVLSQDLLYRITIMSLVLLIKWRTLFPHPCPVAHVQRVCTHKNFSTLMVSIIKSEIIGNVQCCMSTLWLATLRLDAGKLLM